MVSRCLGIDFGWGVLCLRCPAVVCGSCRATSLSLEAIFGSDRRASGWSDGSFVRSPRNDCLGTWSLSY
jgi:hypothetical protein